MRILATALGLVLAASALPLAAQTWQDDLTLVTLNPGQNLPGVVGVRHADDGSDRLFAIVRTGQIRIFDSNRTLQPTPFLSFQANSPPFGFTPVVGNSGDERGLLGLAFHPLHASNGKFYVYYIDGNGDSVVTEYKRSASNANVADPASARVILRIWQPASNHNGGDIHFGSDGYLYVGMGDGGNQDDATCNAGQSLSTATMTCTIGTSDAFRTAVAGHPAGNIESRALLGKMLRIDVDSTAAPAGADRCGIDPANVRYGIPSDNPFAGDSGGNAGACDEIYHYGLRNPYRFSFDRDTHDLIIGDVGQSRFEEVDLVGPAGGLNFGWNLCEGFNARGSTTADCPLAGATDPILVYGRALGVSITGGFRYRGPYAELQGLLFFAEAYDERLFVASESGGVWSRAEVPQGSNIGTIVGFGEDEAGHLYLTTLQGAVRRFTLPEPPAALTLAQSAAGTPGPGASVTVQVTVTNDSAQAIDGIAGTGTLQGATPLPLTCQATTLAAGLSTQCSVTHVVTQAQFDANAGLTHLAEVSAALPDDTAVSSEDTITVALAAPVSALDMSLSATPSGGVGVGAQIAVTAQVTNTGNVTQSGVAVTGSAVATCNTTTLAPTTSTLCAFAPYTVTQADVDAGSITYEADAIGTGVRGGAAGDEAVLDVPTVVAAPEVVTSLVLAAVTDADGDGLVEPGDTVRIETTAGNDGNVTLTDVSVTAMPGGVATCAASLAPTEDVDCTAIDHVVQAADIVDGLFRVSVRADGQPPQDLPRVASAAVQATLPGEVVVVPEIFADGFEAAAVAPR